MRKSVLVIVILLTSFAAAHANQVLELENEIRLPLPSGWSLDSNVTGYPFALISPDSAAEMLVFKSVIAADLAVESREDFRLSVDSIIGSVIMQLPEAEVLTNHGYCDGDRAWFVLEFVTTDTVATVSLWHRLQGILYRHPEGHQLLFTLWGRRPVSVVEESGEDFRLIQDGFAYRGPATGDVFSAPVVFSNWHIAALFAVLILLLWMKKRRRKTVEFSSRENIWRCDCGRMNHVESATCRRCGRDRIPTNVT